MFHIQFIAWAETEWPLAPAYYGYRQAEAHLSKLPLDFHSPNPEMWCIRHTCQYLCGWLEFAVVAVTTFVTCYVWYPHLVSSKVCKLFTTNEFDMKDLMASPIQIIMVSWWRQYQMMDTFQQESILNSTAMLLLAILWYGISVTWGTYLILRSTSIIDWNIWSGRHCLSSLVEYIENRIAELVSMHDEPVTQMHNLEGHVPCFSHVIVSPAYW